MRRRLRLLWPALILVFTAHAQEKSFFDFSSMGLQYYLGTSIGITYNRIRDARPFICEMYYQQQTNPSPTWNNTKRLPQWGLGAAKGRRQSKRFTPYVRQHLPGALTLRFLFRLRAACRHDPADCAAGAAGRYRRRGFDAADVRSRRDRRLG